MPKGKSGKVLNIHGAMANAPVVLPGDTALQAVIADYGTFDARTREAIALVVANVDRCSNCQSAHTADGKAADLTTEQTVGIRDGSYAKNPKLAALFTQVRESTGNLRTVDGATW